MLQRFNSVLLHNTLSVDHPTFWFFCVFNPGDLYYQKKIIIQQFYGAVLTAISILRVHPVQLMNADSMSVSSPLLLLTTHCAYRVWFYLLSTMYTRVICNSTHTVTECYCLTGLSFWICSSLGHVKETIFNCVASSESGWLDIYWCSS